MYMAKLALLLPLEVLVVAIRTYALRSNSVTEQQSNRATE
jgi:hypothetical protein